MRIRTLLVTAAAATIGAATLLVTSGPSAAATAPAPVSNLTVYARYDHTLRVSWSVPAAAYDPGASVIVRWTRGYTPAPTAISGYPAVFLQYPHTAQARPLTANAVYTFAVWVHDDHGYSARRTVTGLTRPDVTPPHPLTGLTGREVLDQYGQPGVRVSLSYAADSDIAGVRIVTNTRDTTTGGTAYWLAGRPSTFLDQLTVGATRQYYWAIPEDTSGHYAAHYVPTSVATDDRHVGGAYTQPADGPPTRPAIFDASGTRVDSRDNLSTDGNGLWYALLPAGRYTVCEYAPETSGAPYASGCWAPDGSTPTWGPPTDPAHWPAAAVQAVDVTAPVYINNIYINLSRS